MHQYSIKKRSNKIIKGVRLHCKSRRKSAKRQRKSAKRQRKSRRTSARRKKSKRQRKKSTRKSRRVKHQRKLHSFDNTSGKQQKVKKYKITSKMRFSQCRDSKDFCNVTGVFTADALKTLKNFIPVSKGNENEVAGPLVIQKSYNFNDRAKYQVYEINVDHKGVKGGNDQEVDAVETKYNFHSHPEAAYIAHDCELGWPSRDDYITFLDGFFKYDTTFHAIASREGIYILKVNPCVINKIFDFYKKLPEKHKDEFIDLVDNWADEYINISKVGLKISEGKPAPKTGEMVKTPRQYVDFINNSVCDKIKCNGKDLNINAPLFDIEYMDWKSAGKMNKSGSFDFSVRKSKSGKCNLH